jgi:hypothetical protein
MNSPIWNKIENLSKQIELKFEQTGVKVTGHETKYNWYNSVYTSNRYRRAHLEIVDNRASHKIYILHCTIFPHFNDPSPIWGFDAVCGPNKITGAFHDFSSGGDKNHFMMNWFKTESQSINWKKERDLPQWAQMIFSPAMIAAGNVSDEKELDQLCDIGLTSLDYYLNNIGLSQESGAEYHMAQNRYCYYQKQNPHVVNSMVAMGVEKQTMINFINEVLFPEYID